MRNHIRLFPVIAALGLLMIVASGCSTGAKKSRYLDRAKRYVESGKYDSAEVEYLNVLKMEPANAEAICQLAVIYHEQGQSGKMFPFLYRAREVQPENAEVRLKLGQSLVTVRKMDEARAEANFVLSRKPQLEGAPLLLADSSFKPEEIVEAKRALQSLPPAIAESAPVIVALGVFDLREGKVREAEAAFRKALATDPKSQPANLALGLVLWNRKDLPNASRAYAAAAEAAPARSVARMQYMQFKLRTGDSAGAKDMLNEMTKIAPDYLPAWMSLAEIATGERNYDAGLSAVAKVLARDFTHPEALLLSARIRMAKGEIEAAVAELEKATKVYPKAPTAHYQLGTAYQAKGDLGNAALSYKIAISLAPEFSEAIIALASINVRNGDFPIAIQALKPLLQGRAGTAQAWLLLASAYRGAGQLDQAHAVYRELAKNAPTPETFLLMGLVLADQKKPQEARQAFEQALKLDSNYVPAAEQIAALDFSENKAEAAIQRVEGLIAKNPKLAGLHLLLGKIYFSQSDGAKAEAPLLRSLELDPTMSAAHSMLARIYVSTRQFDKALARLRDMTARNPNDTGTWTQIGVLYNEQKNYQAARETYEKLLTIDPKSPAALNNLSCLYLDHFGEVDKAYEMAQRARSFVPNDASTADTLGWVLYAKKQFPSALTLLMESAEKIPSSPDVNFHLGMTHYMLGEEPAARVALQRALQLSADFSGSGDAKSRLAILEIDAQKAGPEAVAILEKALVEQGNALPVLTRLGSIHERNGASDKAIAAYEAVLKTKPESVNAIGALTRLYLARKDMAKALELAKTARKLAPGDPSVAHSAGRLAYLAGDHTWSTSLLQEAVRKLPDDPVLLFDFAEAAYSVGRVRDAETAMSQALKSDPASPFAESARRFLEMVSISSDPAQSANADARVAEVLRSSPSDVPALIAQAALANQRGDVAAARQSYEKALGIFPNFLPAKRHLAVIYSENPADDAKTLEFASKSREAFPDDAELAGVLGTVAYRKNNFTTARNLLRDSVAKRPTDARLTYYLGMAEYRLKDLPAAKKSLERSIELNLKGDLLAEARKVIAEIK